MKTCKWLLLLLIVSIEGCLFMLNAQTVRQVTLQGYVKDSVSKAPIPYATVRVTDANGAIGCGVTQADGGFVITTGCGTKTIVVSCMGYRTFTRELQVADSTVLGDVLLQPDTRFLAQVEVKGTRAYVRREVDRLVVDAKSLSALSANALDLLKQTPGLLVNDEGVVSVIGKSRVIVLMNGRETHMTDVELAAYLKNLPSQRIERIEVMTTPPAKYSAEGEAGVVNLVEQRSLLDYVGGSITDQHYAYKGQTNDLSANLKYQQGKWFLYANGLLGLGTQRDGSVEHRKYASVDWQQRNDGKKSNGYGSVDVGFEHTMNNGFRVGGHYALLSFTPDRNVTRLVSLTDADMGSSSQFTGLNEIRRKMLRHNSALYISKTWDERASAVLDVNYIRHAFDENDRYRATGDEAFGYNNLFDRTTDMLVAKLDVDMLTKKYRASFGTSYQYTHTQNHASYLENTALPNQFDAFKYREQIVALYGDITFKPLPKVASKVGLRSEATFANGRQMDVDVHVKPRYVHFFPTVYVRYTPNQHHVLNLSYGSRISRPTFAVLNPFTRYDDKYNLTAGSPQLSPSVSHSVELGYTFMQNLNISLSYRRNTAVVDVIPTLLDNGMVLHAYKNAATQQLLLLSANYRWTPAAWLNFTFGSYGYRTQERSTAYSRPVENHGFTFLMYGIGTAYLNKQKTWVAELNSQYQSKETYALLTRTPRFYLHAGIKHVALKGKLNLGAQIQNLLHNQVGYTQISPQGYYIRQRDDVYRYFKIFVSYNFGSFIKKNVRRTSESLLDRLDN